MASSINLTRLLQSTLVELEKTEELSANSHTTGELRASILRTMAELQLARTKRIEDQQHLHLVASPDESKPEDEQDSSAVA